MIKRWWPVLFCLAPLAACSRSGEVVVHAAIGRDTAGAPLGIDKLVVTLVPYDRDSIFEALAAQAPAPEPQIPQDLLAIRDSVAELRNFWTEAESQWSVVRDEMLKLSEQMKTMNRRSRAYVQAFGRFTELESQERRLARAKDAAFQQYERLQKQYSSRADSIKVIRFNWEDEAFARYGEIVDSLLAVRKREALVDTTASGGYAHFRVPAGRWYVYTRYELPFQELYFNIPLDIQAGRQDTVTLTREKAEIRPLL